MFAIEIKSINQCLQKNKYINFKFANHWKMILSRYLMKQIIINAKYNSIFYY